MEVIWKVSGEKVGVVVKLKYNDIYIYIYKYIYFLH